MVNAVLVDTTHLHLVDTTTLEYVVMIFPKHGNKYLSKDACKLYNLIDLY